MSLYTRLAAGVLFPLHERFKGHATVAVRQRLEQSQWWEPERIAQGQLQRLREFLVEIGQRVPYHRELFARLGFDPAGIRSIDDLRRLPTMSKPDMRTHADRLAAEGHGPLTRLSTGGSSGQPLAFYVGAARTSHDVAAKWRATRWWGVDIGDPEAVLWASPIELGAQDRVRQLRDAVFRSRLFPAFEMSEARLDEFVQALRRQRPRMLFGYPSALMHLARYAQRRGVDMSGLGCRVAFTTGERLYDEQRQLIGEVFGCPVANGYGGRDAGFVAHECPAGGMHVMAEDIVVELLGPQGEPVPTGVPGEIVVTHLASAEFPFVRYRTGDMAVRDDRRCACGRGLPLLREIQGRSNDFIVAADGTHMQSAALTYLLRDLPGIEAFKIVQETLALTRLLLVASPAFDRARVPEIVAGFRRRLGEAVNVEVSFVDAIPAEKSGKYRYIISHVADATRAPALAAEASP